MSSLLQSYLIINKASCCPDDKSYKPCWPSVACTNLLCVTLPVISDQLCLSELWIIFLNFGQCIAASSNGGGGGGLFIYLKFKTFLFLQ